MDEKVAKKKQTQEEKRAGQSVRRHLKNTAVISEIKTAIKRTVAAIKTQPKDLKSIVSQTYKTIDAAVSKGVIHRNFAARKKSRLMLLLNKKPATAAGK